MLQSNLAIPRLQAMGKDLPLIVMVRDPALRAVSHHAMIADKAATPQQRRSRGTAWLGKSVREVAEALLEAKGVLAQAQARYLNDRGG